MTTTPFSLRLAWARSLFDNGDHRAAAIELAALLAEAEREPMLHGTAELRLLLARAYYHSAQLARAETILVELVEQEPTDAYAHLLLGRTLQRAGRHEEAKRPLALAEILGDYERPQAYGSGADGAESTD